MEASSRTLAARSESDMEWDGVSTLFNWEVSSVD